MQVAQGHVTDRPFARTFYTVAVRRFTGDLVLSEGGRTYKVSWEDGGVVAGESPAPADSPARVALSTGLVSSTHVAHLLDRLAAEPGRDPVEVLADLARLSREQVVRLKRRLLAQRAARLFALGEASFVLDNARSLRADADVPAIDARWLVHHGVITHYSIERLERELQPLDGRAVGLAADAAASLPSFGFNEGERGVVERLRLRALTPAQLVEASSDVEPRVALSVLYVLVACDCLEVRAGAATPERPGARATRPPAAAAARSTQPPPSTAAAAGARSTQPPPTAAARSTQPPPTAAARSTQPPPAAAARSTQPPPAASRPPSTPPRPNQLAQGTVRPIEFLHRDHRHAGPTAPPPTARPARTTRTTLTPPRRPRLSSAPPDSAAANEIRALVTAKVHEIDAGVDHYGLLGLGRRAAVEEVRVAYFGMAKRLHPDRLRAVGALDTSRDAQRLFARINQAFAALSDPQRRAEYDRMLAAGGEEVVKKAQTDAEELAARILKAEEDFRLGEMALRRNQLEQARDLFEQACTLNPDEAEYHALLAWVTWLTADDKVAVAAAVQKRLTQALSLQPRCVSAHFYRAQVAKQSGRTQAAIEGFKSVLQLVPDHADASLELRLLHSRHKAGDGDSDKPRASFLDRLKKR